MPYQLSFPHSTPQIIQTEVLFQDRCGITNFAQAESQENTSSNPYPQALSSARHLCPHVTLRKSSVVAVNEPISPFMHFPSTQLRC